jgi:Na+(H+)/acetate symporter ActP
MNGSAREGLQIFLVVGAVFLLGQGIWFFANSRLPSWMKGIWKWPLGDNYPAAVAHLIGWASVLAGGAAIPTLVVLGLWDRSTATGIAEMTSMFLAGAASFAMAWSVFLSRSKLAQGS